MHILGIETSCDETACAVVSDGTLIRSSVVSSSVAFHRKYGGIVPEIAFRKQLETVSEVVECAFHEAGVRRGDIAAIAFTEKPGLLGSLLVGISFARALGLALGIPVIPVDHLYGHIYACFLGKKDAVRFPCVGLIVSGGHTSLYYLKDYLDLKLLGSTQDDACGEAFDKVAKILQLGYPGGPVIEKRARAGDPRAIRFSCSNTKAPLDFSFSGIKTAVLYYTQKHPAERRRIADICASFQDAALNTLVDKSLLACTIKKTDTLAVGGGVAANTALREKFQEQARRRGIRVLFPDKPLCMDNAAMIAGLGYHLYKLARKRGYDHAH